MGTKDDLTILKVKLFQGQAQRSTGTGFGGKSSQVKIKDPTFFCTALKKSRFYLYTQREPEASSIKAGERDIQNEKM